MFTKVYGYGTSRCAIWLTFFAMALLAGMGQMAVALPPVPEWYGQEAYATFFGLVPRFTIANLIAYWAGELTIGSTVTGRAVDTTVMILIAFAGSQSSAMLLRMILFSYMIKIAVEVFATLATHLVAGWFKRAERVDAFDRGANFNPFALQQESI